MDEIPADLIINFDQTGINYVPVSSWTMEKEGSKRVEITGKDDKRQITAVLAGTVNGNFLPVQLIYKGTTKRCLSTFKFPDDWDQTHGSVSAAKKTKKTGKNRHRTQVCYLRAP